MTSSTGKTTTPPPSTRVNNYNALLLTENNGEHMIVAIDASDGDFLMVHRYYMNADQWCMDWVVLSMASI